MNQSTILIVEDESIVAMDIEDRLAGMGYQLSGRAASGDHALEIAEHTRPDLVLMDIRLKGDMDGIAAAEEIRRRFHIPVIFLTAYSEDATLDRAKFAEPYGYILKPFDDRELKSAIEIALYKHHAEEEIRRLNRLYDVLSQVNQAVVRAHSREELLPEVCRLMVERGNIDLAWIGWLDPVTAKIDPVARFGDSEILQGQNIDSDDRVVERGNPGEVIREAKPVVCSNCGNGTCDSPCAQVPAKYGFRSYGVFPLRFQDHLCGTLNLCAREPGFFRRREIDLLEEVAMDVSFALDKIEKAVRQEMTEKALRESEERLNLALAASRMGVWEWDIRSNAVFWSPECHKIYGVENFGGSLDSFISILLPEDAPIFTSMIDKALADKGVYSAEYRINGPNGKTVWISDLGQVYFEETGEPLRMVGIAQDITARKKAEEVQAHAEAQLRQAQKMESLGTLAGGIAHDFNNILGVIVGYTEIAQWETPEDSSLRKNLQEVLKAANRATELVKQILAFSRQREQEVKPVQVGLIVKEALRMLRASLPSTIEILSDVNTKTVVQVDPTQMHQVLMNLCTNAGHAMQDKGGVLSVNLKNANLGPESIQPHSGLQPGPHVRLTVKDTGHGIPPAVLDRIFDPFFTTKGPGVGTGLGLAVVHGIVKSHGGAIEVESSVGKGTAFHVLLPATESASAPEAAQFTPLPRGSERILVVDDEPALAITTRKMLERLGYDVDYRTSSVGALEVFRLGLEDKPFDLVITDMTMPQLTGLDLTRELLHDQPDLPVILCTGFSEKINDEKAKSLGIKGLLMKPFILRDLAEMIRKVLDK